MGPRVVFRLHIVHDIESCIYLYKYNFYDVICLDHLLVTLDFLHPFNDLFSKTSWVSWYQKGKTSQDFNEARDDMVFGMPWPHQLDHVQTMCTSLQTDNQTNTTSLNFYRPDALPDAQPTISKN